ncbi:hypothetical protein TNCV_1232181 [Trichonephila clavipes]|nr:hypothetical protein TNCV_1232181 [Trichonephila clavipes]
MFDPSSFANPTPLELTLMLREMYFQGGGTLHLVRSNQKSPWIQISGSVFFYDVMGTTRNNSRPGENYLLDFQESINGEEGETQRM